jgi:multiple sugar transport system substrate-binding protein
MALLPADADQQREQLVRRLAAGDSDIDIIGMDVIWTAEFAEAGWILPWPEDHAREATRGRLARLVDTASYRDQLWAAPFTTNTQLLWYRDDRVRTPPATWDEMIRMAESLGDHGTIEAQGERYEGLTVFFISLLASAGGSVLEPDSQRVSLEEAPTRAALSVMKHLATSPAADPSLSTAREDQARLAFEAGNSSFMINYTFVWPSAKANAPDVASHMRWARWPAVFEGTPSRVTIGGINLGVGAHTRRPQLAYAAAACLASEQNQRLAAMLGGLPPTVAALYDDPEVRKTFPFADLLRETLRDSVERPKTPLYVDVSLAISHTLHPMRDIDPIEDVRRLREAVSRALRSEGLL